MQLTKQHLIATGLVAATVVPYLGYTIAGDIPFIDDARGMGAVGLVLGAAAWFVLGRHAFGPTWVGVGSGILAVVLGVAAAILETGTLSSVLLGAFVAVMVAMLAIALLRHADVLDGRGTHRRMTPRHT